MDCARQVEGSYRAVGVTQESMHYTRSIGVHPLVVYDFRRILVASGNFARVVDALRKCAPAALDVECKKATELVAQESMSHVLRINEVAGDYSGVVHAGGHRALSSE